ncbi:MAG: glycosyltransferase [Gallionella sp.]|nr:glycosyltransferase [Gallionella sp.]
MVRADSQNSLLVLGVHLKSEGYPNTLYRLREMEASGLFQMSEINVPMWSESTQNRHGLSRLTRNLWRAVIAHIAVTIRYLAATRPERVYVPYPAVFVLFLLSWLPAWRRPGYVVADVFISLYDTIVLDRRLIKQGGLTARMLKWIETRAYAGADKLVADTPQNARFLCEIFKLPEAKIIAVPLSTDEIHFKYTPYLPSHGVCRVLFVGTMIPLHGMETILEAANLLSERSDIHFKLIGDGQDAPIVEARLRAHMPNLEWERTWQSSQQIAEEISRADICLGIFGAGGKAQRVCPFKIYAYASMGRAVITGETRWLRETVQPLGETFASVPVNNAAALAAKIIQLADAPALRANLAANSRQFYENHLSNQAALRQLVNVFF